MINELDVKIQFEKSDSSFLQFKIIVIGNSGVGKSSLLFRATQNVFNEIYKPTIECDYFYVFVKIDSKRIKLNFWDTCGQEIYRSLIQNYYRNSSLAIVVYSIENIHSFEDVDSWVKELKQYSSPDIKIFLIGNKSDSTKEYVLLMSFRRVVTYQMGEDMAKELKLDYFIETSARDDINTKELIIKVTQILYSEYKKLISNQNLNLLSDSVMVKLYKNQNILLKEEHSNHKRCCQS